MYAIFESGGKQHRAEPGQRVAVERLEAKDGEAVSFDRVLLVRGDEDGETRIGDPYLAGTSVAATVIAHYRDPKVLVFKRKRRKRYRKKQGHRQARTVCRIEAVRTEAPPPEPALTEPSPTETAPTEPLPTETAPAESSPTEAAPAESSPTEAASADTAGTAPATPTD